MNSLELAAQPVVHPRDTTSSITLRSLRLAALLHSVVIRISRTSCPSERTETLTHSAHAGQDNFRAEPSSLETTGPVGPHARLFRLRAIVPNEDPLKDLGHTVLTDLALQVVLTGSTHSLRARLVFGALARLWITDVPVAVFLALAAEARPKVLAAELGDADAPIRECLFAVVVRLAANAVVRCIAERTRRIRAIFACATLNAARLTFKAMRRFFVTSVSTRSSEVAAAAARQVPGTTRCAPKVLTASPRAPSPACAREGLASA